jgi:uncharacterized protein (DUF3820 family)
MSETLKNILVARRNMKMPFGKHKDKDLSEIPKPYLRWLRGQEWIGGWLAYALDEALGKTVAERRKEPWQPSDGEPWEGSNG